MNYNKLAYYISHPRITRFLRASGDSKTKAQQLYKINLRVAQSFYPLMNLFEIFLRNALYNQISIHFADRDWILTQKNGFMSGHNLAHSRYFLRTSVISAENNIRRFGGAVNSGKVIAEQPLGFWTSFFESYHYSILRGAPIAAFANKPNAANRTIILSKLKNIRGFRNRIYHNEPICFRGNTVDFTKAKEVRDDVCLLISWIDPELLTYTNFFDNIDQKIAQADGL